MVDATADSPGVKTEKTRENRFSLVDRARVFEPDFPQNAPTSPLEPKKPSLEALLQASVHRRQENVSDGRREAYPRVSRRMRVGNGGPLYSKGISTGGIKRSVNNKKVPRKKMAAVSAPTLPVDPMTFQPERHPKTQFQMTLILKAITNQSYVLRNQQQRTKERLADAMEPMNLPEGEILQKQNELLEKDDQMYVVEDGQLDVEVDGVTVQTLEAGSCINEERLLQRSKNTMTVRAKSQSKLFRLDQVTFRAIMQQENQKSIADQTKAKVETKKKVEKKKTSKGASPVEPTTYSFEWRQESQVLQYREAVRTAIKKQAPNKDDMEMIQLLGDGQFGEVWHVATDLALPDGDGRQEFALKIQQLQGEDGSTEAEASIQREIKALQCLQHPFIVNLVHTYKSEESIDMLLDLIPGGELWSQIHYEDADGNWISEGISEAKARFYTYVLTDTLAFIHASNYIYRDLKPENVMIDKDGYPVLVDFGFAKQSKAPSDRTFTFCGTPNYVAPEIITMAGHGPAVDYWALGIVLYEMMTSENPFFYEGMGNSEVYGAITEEQPYPIKEDENEEVNPSKNVRNILDRLLEKNPDKRIGTNGAHEVLAHPWFQAMPAMMDFREKKVDISNCEAWTPTEFNAQPTPPPPPPDVEPSPEPMQIESKPSGEKTKVEDSDDDDDDKSFCVDEMLEPVIEEKPAVKSSSEKGPIENSPTSERQRQLEGSSLGGSNTSTYMSPRAVGKSLKSPISTGSRKGYYVNMKSPLEKTNSKARRSIVKEMMESYGALDLEAEG